MADATTIPPAECVVAARNCGLVKPKIEKETFDETACDNEENNTKK